jgi:PilZ domain-containing protein
VPFGVAAHAGRDVDAHAAPSGHKPAPAPVQPTRRATRHAFHDDVTVEIDGVEVMVVDLSIIGAQLVAMSTLKPNRVVSLVLPREGRPITCTGKIVWARLEPDAESGALRYRAGVFFTNVDETAVEEFIALHTRPAR